MQDKFQITTMKGWMIIIEMFKKTEDEKNNLIDNIV